MIDENFSQNIDDAPEEQNPDSETPAFHPAASDAPTLIQRPSQNREDASVSESGNRIEMKPSYPFEEPVEFPETIMTFASTPEDVQGVNELLLQEPPLLEADSTAVPPSRMENAQNAEPQTDGNEQKRAEIAQKLKKIKAAIEVRQKKYQQIADALEQGTLPDVLQASKKSEINPYDPFASLERIKNELARVQGDARKLNETAQQVSKSAREIQQSAIQAQENLTDLENLDQQAQSKAELVRGQLSNAQKYSRTIEELVQSAQENAAQINNALQAAEMDATALENLAQTAESQAQNITNHRTAAEEEKKKLEEWLGFAKAAEASIRNALTHIENVIQREMALQVVQQFAAQVQQSPAAWLNTSTLLIALQQLANLIGHIDETSKQHLIESIERLRDSLSLPGLGKYGSLDSQAKQDWDTYLSNWLKELK